MKIKRNAIRCKACNETIESKTRHDFKWCSCGMTAVDGGLEYLKRAYGVAGFEELSETCAPEESGK